MVNEEKLLHCIQDLVAEATYQNMSVHDLIKQVRKNVTILNKEAWKKFYDSLTAADLHSIKKLEKPGFLSISALGPDNVRFEITLSYSSQVYHSTVTLYDSETLPLFSLCTEKHTYSESAAYGLPLGHLEHRHSSEHNHSLEWILHTINYYKQFWKIEYNRYQDRLSSY